MQKVKKTVYCLSKYIVSTHLCFIGYGQTECTAMATGTWPADLSGGHVGGPCACCVLKLVDVPELDYYAKDGRGEVCVKVS